MIGYVKPRRRPQLDGEGEFKNGNSVVLCVPLFLSHPAPARKPLDPLVMLTKMIRRVCHRLLPSGPDGCLALDSAGMHAVCKTTHVAPEVDENNNCIDFVFTRGPGGDEPLQC